MQEIKNNKKTYKRIVIFSLLIILLFTLFKLPANMLNIPDYCQEIENGWSCNLKDRNNKNTFDKEESRIKRMCKNKGGVPDCNGPCDKIYCFVPFDDAGKECTNSSQCNGSCIGDYSRIINKYDGAQAPGATVKCNIDDTCSGTCSEIPKTGSCIWYFEVDDGFYIFHGGGWC